MPEFDWHAYGVVIGSEYRKKVVNSITSGPRTPNEIAEITGIHRNHISSTLKDLTAKGVVACLTPDLRKGKLFALTDLGKEIAKKL